MPYYTKGFPYTILPTSHILTIFIRATIWKKKKSPLCNKRKYISRMIRKNGLEHTHWFPPPARSRSAPNLGWLQKSMCTRIPGLGQIPQILFICSWSGLLSARLEFSILLQMELPSPQGQETPLSCHSVLLLCQCHCILRQSWPASPFHLLPIGASLFWASFSSSAFLVWAQFFHTSSPSSGFREFGSRSSGEGCGCDCGSTSATWTVWAYEKETIKMCQYCFASGRLAKLPEKCYSFVLF